MSDGLSDARDYGPSLSKYDNPLIARGGTPLSGPHEHNMTGLVYACTLCETTYREREVLAENAKLRAEAERLKDKYASCEQCDGSTDAGVFCVPCWNRVNLQLSEAVAALRIVRDEYRSGKIEVAFGLPVEVENAIRRADGIPPVAEKPSCVHSNTSPFGPGEKGLLCEDCGVVVPASSEKRRCACYCHAGGEGSASACNCCM
jgi:hypothetical protein